MILAYLLLAHLVADFVLQPGKLVRWKMKNKVGVLVHASIHFLVNLFLLSPFILQGHYLLIGISFVISFIHFWIDQTKISYDLKHDQKVVPFVLDQVLHLLTIAVFYITIKDLAFTLPESPFYIVYQDIRIVIFLSFLILVGRAFDIYRFQRNREKDQGAHLKVNTNQTLSRIILLCFLYAVFMLIGFYVRYSDVL